MESRAAVRPAHGGGMAGKEARAGKSLRARRSLAGLMSAKMAFRALAGATIYVAITTIAGCGGSAGGSDTSKILSTGETKQIVKELPYAFSFRSVPLPEGATGAV